MAQADETDSEMEGLSDGGEEDEDDDEEEEEEGEDEDEEDGQSFHTDSEDEDADDSEDFEDEGPLDDKTKQLRARMQAMMEAAEARARGDEPAAAATSSKSKLKSPKSAMKATPALAQRPAAAVEEDEDAGFDLAPISSLGKPLPVEVLRRAEESERAKKAKKAEQAAAASAEQKKKAQGGKRTKKRKRAEPTTKIISYVVPVSSLFILRSFAMNTDNWSAVRRRLCMSFLPPTPRPSPRPRSPRSHPS